MRDTDSRGVTSLSARLLQPACRAIGQIRERKPENGISTSCPLVGSKYTTTIEIFGRQWTGLLDTGSEVSIIPAKVLLQAKEDGYDIDRDVVEHEMDQSLQVCDASGEVMSFVTVVEVKMREGKDPRREVIAKMHVTRAMDDFIILGTNVLSALGYELRRQGPVMQPVASRQDEHAVVVRVTHLTDLCLGLCVWHNGLMWRRGQ